MGFRKYTHPDANEVGRQGGSLRWTIPAQLHRDVGLECGDQPEWYGFEDETGTLLVSFDEDIEDVRVTDDGLELVTAD